MEITDSKNSKGFSQLTMLSSLPEIYHEFKSMVRIRVYSKKGDFRRVGIALKKSQSIILASTSFDLQSNSLPTSPTRFTTAAGWSHRTSSLFIHIYKYFGKLIQFLRLCPLQTNELAFPALAIPSTRKPTTRTTRTDQADDDDDYDDDDVVPILAALHNSEISFAAK